MPLASVRGATTCLANDSAAVLAATKELLTALRQANPALTPGSTLAAFFTVTPDIDAAFPATTARACGFAETALLGAHEAAVPGAPARCIRVLLLYELDGSGRPARAARGTPVYLHEAARLRPDLAADDPSPTAQQGGGRR